MLQEHLHKLNVRVSLFVQNLYKILSDVNHSDMIAWDQSGSKLIIKDQVSLASKVLPQYYETNKFASFSRQLNIYGFYRVSDRRRTKQRVDTAEIVYFHPYFRQNQPELLYLVQRIMGPYPQAKTRLASIEAAIVNKPPSPPPVPCSTSTPELIFQYISADNCVKEATEECLHCKTLKQEIASLRKVVEYYTSILSELLLGRDASQTFRGLPEYLSTQSPEILPMHLLTTVDTSKEGLFNICDSTPSDNLSSSLCSALLPLDDG